MAYTALELITRAFYLSQVVSRGLQVPSAEQINDGLYLLNALIDFKNADLREIPYYQEYIFETVQGQEMYSVPNLLSVDTMTFNIGDVRYSMEEQTRTYYFGIPRVDMVQSLPFQYRVERTLDGCNVYMYFVPAQVYVIKIWGKFALMNVTLQSDMSQIYDLFYIEFLRYSLAIYICAEWGATPPDLVVSQHKELQKKIMDVSPPDLSIRSQNLIGPANSITWGLINMPGYTNW